MCLIYATQFLSLVYCKHIACDKMIPCMTVFKKKQRVSRTDFRDFEATSAKTLNIL